MSSVLLYPSYCLCGVWGPQFLCAWWIAVSRWWATPWNWQGFPLVVCTPLGVLGSFCSSPHRSYGYTPIIFVSGEKHLLYLRLERTRTATPHLFFYWVRSEVSLGLCCIEYPVGMSCRRCLEISNKVKCILSSFHWLIFLRKHSDLVSNNDDSFPCSVCFTALLQYVCIAFFIMASLTSLWAKKCNEIIEGLILSGIQLSGWWKHSATPRNEPIRINDIKSCQL